MKPHCIVASSSARRTLGANLLLLALCAATPSAASEQALERAPVEPGIDLEYTVRGDGDPVVLVHAGLFAEWFRPLLEQPALTSRYRVLSFHRVGYAGSSRVPGTVDVARQAAHVRALMQRLGIARAHIVGHSSGGNIALQLALDAPEQVHSLSILEPALPVGAGSERLLATRKAAIAPVLEQFRSGNRAGAVDGFMRMVAGPAYRTPFDQALPEAFDQGVADADTFFAQELPAIQQWRFAREDANRITQPVLVIMGENSPQVSPIWPERQRLLLAWLPNVESFVLPGTTHLLHVQNARGMAQALISFFARHPMAGAP